jgi:hypothetical protein
LQAQHIDYCEAKIAFLEAEQTSAKEKMACMEAKLADLEATIEKLEQFSIGVEWCACKS